MQRLRRIVLVTSTVSWLYKKHQYTPVNQKDFVWHIFRPDIYVSCTLSFARDKLIELLRWRD